MVESGSCEALRHFMYCERCEKNHGALGADGCFHKLGSFWWCLYSKSLTILDLEQGPDFWKLSNGRAVGGPFWWCPESKSPTV